MDFSLPFLLFCLLVSSAAADCDRCAHQSKATFFRSFAPLSSGACGYKSDYLALSGQGYVGSGSPKLFRQGVGCGSCFQVRCRNPDLCTTGGVKIVLTDSQGDDQTQTDFVLAMPTVLRLAKEGMARNLVQLGIVDIEYKRVPCVYNDRPSMRVEVEDQSNKPGYLAIKFLYQGGQTDIIAVEVAAVGSDNWFSLNRSYGAIWDTNQVPKGDLKLRVAVAGGKSFTTNKLVLPADWQKGVTYDTGIHLTDVIEQEKCYPCDTSIWN